MLFLSEVFADSWDKVAQETRTQLERTQEWVGITGDKMLFRSEWE